MASKIVAHGQLTLSGSAQQLVGATQITGDTILIKPHKANTAVCYLGAAGVTAGTGFEMSQSEPYAFDYLDPNEFYVIGTSSDKVSYLIIGD
jgi:hypothetical protein